MKPCMADLKETGLCHFIKSLHCVCVCAENLFSAILSRHAVKLIALSNTFDTSYIS